jgi:cobalt/nickel transport system permease protein
MLKEEVYNPLPDRDIYIDKTIIGLLSVISRIRGSDGTKAGFIYNIDSTIKLLCLLVMLIFISLSGSLKFVILADSMILLGLSLMKLRDILKILSILLVITVFSSVLLLPVILKGGFTPSVLIVILKITGCAAFANIFAYSTRWSRVSRALKRFFIPAVFIQVLDITIKYICLLGEFSLQMFYSLKLRSIGRNRKKILSLSGLVGGLFVKSLESSELLYSAMECRCYDGKYVTGIKMKVTVEEIVYAVSCLLICSFFFII